MSALRSIAGASGHAKGTPPAVAGGTEGGRSDPGAGGVFAAVLGVIGAIGETVATKPGADAAAGGGGDAAETPAAPRHHGDDGKDGLATALAAALPTALSPLPSLPAQTSASPDAGPPAAAAPLVATSGHPAPVPPPTVAPDAAPIARWADPAALVVDMPAAPVAAAPETTAGSPREPTAMPTIRPTAAGGATSAAVPAIALPTETDAVAAAAPAPGAAAPAPDAPAPSIAARPEIVAPELGLLPQAGPPGGGQPVQGDGRFGPGDRNRDAPVSATPPGEVAAGALGGGTAAAPTAPGTAADASGVIAGTPTDAAADGIGAQASGHVLRLLGSGAREITVQLHPPELGALTVRIEVSGRNVSAWFDAPQPQAQQAISDGLGQLRADLGGAGYNLSGAWVGGQGSDGRPRGSFLPDGGVPARPAPGAAAPGAAVRAANSEVSIYV